MGYSKWPQEPSVECLWIGTRQQRLREIWTAPTTTASGEWHENLRPWPDLGGLSECHPWLHAALPPPSRNVSRCQPWREDSLKRRREDGKRPQDIAKYQHYLRARLRRMSSTPAGRRVYLNFLCTRGQGGREGGVPHGPAATMPSTGTGPPRVRSSDRARSASQMEMGILSRPTKIERS